MIANHAHMCLGIPPKLERDDGGTTEGEGGDPDSPEIQSPEQRGSVFLSPGLLREHGGVGWR